MAKTPSKLHPIQPPAAPAAPAPVPDVGPLHTAVEPALAEVQAAVTAIEAAVETAEPVQTAEVVQAQTRYGFPVYVPTQKKLLAPNEVYPLILDAWVRNQLEQERGALVRAKL